MNSPLTNFENLEQKFAHAVTSEKYSLLIKLLEKHSQIYIIGNGGLHYVASHMATDMSRLLNNKYFYSFDSFGFITSSANDYGFDSIFERWLTNCVPNDNKALVIGLSCSGKSKNIINAFEYAKDIGWDIFFVTGKESSYEYDSLSIEAKHFHTVETFCLMLFYELIHSLGGSCPKI
tara:strand:- start:5614 stop:6144 length:531 start_codon:yes stop_codon:yes gene_type:complete